jgi:hypothetical protein
MPEVEVLVGELVAVDALGPRAVALHEVAPLDHEVLHHAVEGRALVPDRQAVFAVLACHCTNADDMDLLVMSNWKHEPLCVLLFRV